MFTGHCACGNCDGIVLYSGDSAASVLDQFDTLTNEIVEQTKGLAKLAGVEDQYAALADKQRDKLNSVPVRIVELDEQGRELTSEVGTPDQLRQIYATA